MIKAQPLVNHNLLSVKQEQPGDIQADVDDNRDVKSIREHCRRGVHPLISISAGSMDNVVRVAGENTAQRTNQVHGEIIRRFHA